MHRYIRAAATLFAAVALSATITGVAHATTTTVTLKATIVNSPDDGCPAWARDTFIRTTTITPLGEDKYKVTIKDVGTFATKVGADSPGDPAVKIATVVKGNLTGSGEFTVTGKLLYRKALHDLDGDKYDNGAYACKADVPADRTTGQWPLKFFTHGATTTGINPWTWTYKTPCETRTESSAAAAVGNITGKVCPSASPSASASVKVSKSPTVTPSTTPVASLPVTGTSGTLALIGAAAVLVGGAAILVARRRRKVEFVAE